MITIDEALYGKLCKEAAESPRQRAHHLIHVSRDDPVQRLAVVMHRGTYIRPHRHALPQRWELFCIHRGSAVALTFDDAGRVMERVEMHAGRGPYLVEIPAQQWHTLTALENNSLLSEYKQGPFQPVMESDWAGWAPCEGDDSAKSIAEWFIDAGPGDMVRKSK